ncbi:MAG: hypothetical protein ACRDEA_10190 [Microcystaceae cyanobacterium]
MKASKSISGKALFSVIVAVNLVALSACGQPTVDNRTDPQTAQTPTADVSTVPPIAETPTSPTASKNLAELAKSASAQGSFTTLTRTVQAAGLTKQMAKRCI